MTLAHLSIQRVGHRKVPHVWTPQERMAAWAATRTFQFANNILAVRRDAPTQPDPPDYSYFNTRSYSELSQGY